MSFVNIKEKFLYTLSILLRFFPMPHVVGLKKFGNPSVDSPVFVSGNYIYTVVRLKKELKNKDCYLLVADSAGSNVWCACGVGDFNEHKIADAVNTFELKNIVNHRTLILPQLAAVGIDRNKLFEECGFKVKWGPANYYDISEYFSNGFVVTDKMRLVDWAPRDRISVAIGFLVAYYIFFFYYFIYVLFFGSHYNGYAAFVAVMLFINIGVTAFGFERPFKWPPTYIVITGIFLLILITAYAYLIDPSVKDNLHFYLICSTAISLLIASDSAETDKYKTTAGHWMKTFNTMSLFQPKINDKCTRCGDCLEVCPKGVLKRQKDKSVTADLDKICCECLACVKQCRYEAIVNINKGSYKKDIKVIPNIKMVMK